MNFQINRRESINDQGYLTNYIPFVIYNGKDRRVELHPISVLISPSPHELLSRPSAEYPAHINFLKVYHNS